MEAVRARLTTLIDGDTPGLLLSPHMKWTRKGFNSGYRFRRVQGRNDAYHDTPEKNDYSDPHDATQYLCQKGGQAQAAGRLRERSAAQADRPQFADMD